MSTWVPYTGPTDYRPEPYKHEPHNFVGLGNKYYRLPWLYCKKCGLVKLNNAISKLCVRQGCNYDVSPQYLVWKKQLKSKA